MQIMTASHTPGSALHDAALSPHVNPPPNACTTLAAADRRADYSRFVQRVRRRYPQELDCLPPGEPVHASMQVGLARLLDRQLPMPAALRVLRQLVLERLVVLDCEQGASLATDRKSVV